MAEGIATEVKSGGSAIVQTAKKHYLWFGLVVLVAMVVAFRYRATIQTKLSSVLPSWAKKILAMSAILIVTLTGGDALASICCSAPAAAAGLGGAFWAIVSAIGGGVAFGIVAFGAPDVREAKMLGGAKDFAVDYDTFVGNPTVDFYVDGTTKTDTKGRPMVALDEVIELATSIHNLSTGSAIVDDELARMLVTCKMVEPRILGTILDDTVGTGPILKHVIEFIGHAFNRGADAPVATIAIPGADGSDTSLIRYFTIPHAQRFQANPIVSALWLGLIDNMMISLKLGAANCLAAVSVGAALTGLSHVRVTTPVVGHSHWHAPMVAQYILEQPAGATETVTLQLFGQKNAQGTDPVDYLFLVAQLTNWVGLPGNTQLDNILQIDSEQLGIARLENVPAFWKARLEAQVFGRSPSDFANGNFVQGAVPHGMNIGDGKFLNLRQPGLGMSIDNMRPVGSGFKLPISYKYGSIPATQHGFVLGSMRYMNAAALAQLARLAPSKISPTNRQAIKHHQAR